MDYNGEERLSIYIYSSFCIKGGAMTTVEPNPEVGDGPQGPPKHDDEERSREAGKEWERGQKEPGEHRIPRSDR